MRCAVLLIAIACSAPPRPLGNTAAPEPVMPDRLLACGEAIPKGARALTGVVRDTATSDPLPGATLVIERDLAKAVAAITDNDGCYLLPFPERPRVMLELYYAEHHLALWVRTRPGIGVVDLRVDGYGPARRAVVMLPEIMARPSR